MLLQERLKPWSVLVRAIVLWFAFAGLASEVWAQQDTADKSAAAKDAEVPAEPTPETRKAARAAFEAGQKAFEKEDYAAATENFSKANELIPSVQALYWIAAATDKAGDPAAAYQAYAAYFANPDYEKLGEEKVAAARERQDALAKTPAALTLTTTPADAQLSIDGAPQAGGSPFTVELPMGNHTLSISKPGFVAQERQVEAKPGAKLTEAVTLEAEPPKAEPPPPPAPAPAPAQPVVKPEPRSKAPAYITLGIAGASAIVGTIFGIKALSAKNKYDDSASPTASMADDVERNALIADMAFGVTVTLGITGIVLLTSDEPTEQGAASATRQLAKQKLEVTPYVSKQGGGASARLTF